MLRTMTLADALEVVRQMRQADRDCLRALVGDIEDEAFAVHRWQASGPAWTLADDDGRPLAIFGATLPSAWQAVAWLIAVEGLAPQSWRKLIRHARIVAAHISNPAHPEYRHRVEAFVMSDWSSARRFAHRIGFRHEGTRRGAGSGGEDVETWAIVGPVKGV